MFKIKYNKHKSDKIGKVSERGTKPKKIVWFRKYKLLYLLLPRPIEIDAYNKNNILDK